MITLLIISAIIMIPLTPALPHAGGREEPKDAPKESATNGGVFIVLA
jgi:hypothetical protein